MKKKIILSSIMVACLLLAVFFGIIRFSDDNIENRSKGYENLTVTPNELGIYSIASSDGGIGCFINNLRVEGSFKNVENGIKLHVFSTKSNESSFVNGVLTPFVLVCPVEIKNDDIYILLSDALESAGCSEVASFYFVLEEGESVKSVELNPQKLNVNFILFFFVFLLPTVFAWAIYNTIEDKASFKKDIFAMKRYKYLLYDLVSRDIKTKYRRSALGVMWSVLNPLLMMLVLTAVFSQIIRVEVEGGFALFYLTGYIMFSFVSESSNFSLVSIINAGSLIKKVYVPKYIFPLEKTIFSLVNMLFSLIAFVIVFALFLITGQFDLGDSVLAFFFSNQVSLHPTMLLFFVPMIYIFIFSLGLNLILSALNLFFRDIGHLWSVFITVWMYATPIIYPISVVPSWLQSIIKLNPLYYYVTYFRNIMIYGTLPSLSDNLICIGFSLMFLAIGVVVFRKNQDKFILHM